MDNENQYDKLIRESLKQELRFLNAQVPVKQKSLKDLLEEETPFILCSDGSRQLIKRKELVYISGVIEPEHWQDLLLPVIIEINPGEDKITVVCHGDVEADLFSTILGMTVPVKDSRITIYKPQLAVIRKNLKTTTQYLFSPKILQ